MNADGIRERLAKVDADAAAAEKAAGEQFAREVAAADERRASLDVALKERNARIAAHRRTQRDMLLATAERLTADAQQVIASSKAALVSIADEERTADSGRLAELSAARKTHEQRITWAEDELEKLSSIP